MKSITMYRYYNSNPDKTTPVKFYRVSRWIQIRTNYNPNRKNGLWCYVRDGYGRKDGEEGFDKNDLYLDYFKYNGRAYAIDQFYRLGTMWVAENYKWTEDGETKDLAAVDMDGSIYYPLYLELSPDGEYVRLYEESRENYVPYHL